MDNNETTQRGFLDENPIGVWLQEWRELAGMSQLKLSETSGVRRGTICDIELGKKDPQYKTLIALLAALDIKLQPVPQRGFLDEK